MFSNADDDYNLRQFVQTDDDDDDDGDADADDDYNLRQFVQTESFLLLSSHNFPIPSLLSRRQQFLDKNLWKFPINNFWTKIMGNSQKTISGQNLWKFPKKNRKALEKTQRKSLKPQFPRLKRSSLYPGHHRILLVRN